MKSNSNPMLLEGRMDAVLQMYLDLKPKTKLPWVCSLPLLQLGWVM